MTIEARAGNATSRRAGTWLLGLALLAPSAVFAQTGTTRYTMERTDNGYVRMDTQTGEMSLCQERDGQIVCQMAADDRRAFEEELSALSDRVEKLESAIASGAGRSAGDLPSDEEIDRTMGIMEKFMRRFFAIVDDLNRDEPTAEPGAPDRT